MHIVSLKYGALVNDLFFLAKACLPFVEAKLHGESKVIQRCFDDNKGDDKKLKDQSRTFQEFKIKIQPTKLGHKDKR